VRRQVARDDIDQLGHRRGADESHDQDAADVVDRAETLAERLVRQLGEGPAAGLAAFMSVYLITTSFITAVLIPAGAFLNLRLCSAGQHHRYRTLLDVPCSHPATGTTVSVLLSGCQENGGTGWSDPSGARP